MTSTISIKSEIEKSYLEYSLSVIIGRAIPDVRDGLKPVHRRILFAMHELGNAYNRSYKKSARVVGDVIGKYHPHGDSAVYDALVRMAQDFSMRDVLVDGQGNFGSIDGDAAAAMRYTEVRMSRLAGEFLADIDKDTVDFRPNYDNSLAEPAVLPTKVPSLLLNGTSGIAVGMATNIPPHNLGELVDATLHLLDHPGCTVRELMQWIKGPDFPTAAAFYGGRGLLEAYQTGRGAIRMRGTVELEQKKSGRESLVITQIPYALNKSSLVEKIAALINDKRIDGVSDLRDESDRKGIRIVLDLKKGAISELISNALYKFTPLETTFGINMMAVVGNRPMLLSLKQVLEHFLSHRREVILRRTRFDLDKAEKRAHILEGLLKALDHIDEVVALIRASQTPQEAKQRLSERFGLSDVQSQAILDMRLQRLVNLEREKLRDEYKEILQRIEYLKSILEQEEVLKGVIRDELAEIRQTFATPRKTEVLEGDLEAIAVEDLIPDEEMVLTLSRRGYIKRTTLSSYQQQKRGGKGVAGVQTADNDYVQTMVSTSNHQHLLLFTNRGKMFSLRVHQVPEGNRYAKGTHIANLLPLDTGEHVATLITVREFADETYLLFATKRGMIKKTSAAAYARARSTGIRAVALREDDELIMVRVINGKDEILLMTAEGLAIRFPSAEVRPIGRDAAGVKGIALSDGDEVVAAVVVRPDDEVAAGGEDRRTILTVSQNGYGKRTRVDLYRVQSRGGKGIITMKVTTKTGNLVGGALVLGGEEVLLLTSENKIIRVSADGVNIIGRSTEGVRLVRMEGQGKVSALDVIVPEVSAVLGEDALDQETPQDEGPQA